MKSCIITLAKLNIFTKARIKKILLPYETTLRLKELGLIKGTEIAIVKRSPLKFPVTIRLRGYELCLGKRECEKILVEVEK